MNSGPIQRQAADMPPKAGRLRRDVSREDCQFAMVLLQSLAQDDRLFTEQGTDAHQERPGAGSSAAGVRPATSHPCGDAARAGTAGQPAFSGTRPGQAKRRDDGGTGPAMANGSGCTQTAIRDAASAANAPAASTTIGMNPGISQTAVQPALMDPAGAGAMAVGMEAGMEAGMGALVAAEVAAEASDVQGTGEICPSGLIDDAAPAAEPAAGSASPKTVATSTAATATATNAPATNAAKGAEGAIADAAIQLGKSNQAAAGPANPAGADPSSAEIGEITAIGANSSADSGIVGAVRPESAESLGDERTSSFAARGRGHAVERHSGNGPSDGSGAPFAAAAVDSRLTATRSDAVSLNEVAAAAPSAPASADPAALDVSRLVAAWRLQSDSIGQTLTVRLTPDVFGAMSIRLERTADGLAATIRTDSQTACSLLAAQRDQLESLLFAKGFHCRSVDIALREQARSAAFGPPVTGHDPAGLAHDSVRGQEASQAFTAAHGSGFGQSQAQADRHPDRQTGRAPESLSAPARSRPDGQPRHIETDAVRRNAHGRLDWWA